MGIDFNANCTVSNYAAAESMPITLTEFFFHLGQIILLDLQQLYFCYFVVLLIWAKYYSPRLYAIFSLSSYCCLLALSSSGSSALIGLVILMLLAVYDYVLKKLW